MSILLSSERQNRTEAARGRSLCRTRMRNDLGSRVRPAGASSDENDAVLSPAYDMASPHQRRGECYLTSLFAPTRLLHQDRGGHAREALAELLSGVAQRLRVGAGVDRAK